MMHLKKFFMYSPGGENENSKSTSVKKEEENLTNEQTPKKEEPKPLLKKIKEALQDWSNDDQSDLDFDDTRV